MDLPQIAGYIGIATTLLGTIYIAINHRRVRSKCCGAVMEASVDVENTTPTGRRPAA